MSWIDESIPELKRVGYQETSAADDDYNCIAWAAGKNDEWWSHLKGYKWPRAKRSRLVEDLVEVFESLGYEQCANRDVEEGFEKVVIYTNNGLWSHTARQLDDGQWTSKLGPDEDITHPSAESICGYYGEMHCTMRRPRN